MSVFFKMQEVSKVVFNGRANSLERTLMLGKIEGKRRRGETEDEMVGWHHQLDGCEMEQTQGYSRRQGSLASCSPGGHKESDMT